MAASTTESGPYQAAWNQFVIELRSYMSVVQDWIGTLSIGEKIIGMSLFVLVLMYLIVSRSRKKMDPGSNSRQFTGALILVVIFAFGAGWSMDTGSGSLSHLFGR